MARILINEPHDEVRRLLVRMVVRLGHEPIAARAPSPGQLMSADVFVLDPASPIGAVLAQAARLIDPSMPLVSVSAGAPPPELADLGVVFVAALARPFTLLQLRAAIDWALIARAAGERCGRDGQQGHCDRAA